MRVLHAETIEHRLEAVGLTVAIRVAIEADLSAVLNEGAVAIGEHSERDREPLGEHPRWRGLRRPRIIDHDYLVAATGRKEPPRQFRALVAIDWILERRRGPQPPVGVEGDRDKLAIRVCRVGALFEHEFGSEAVWERELAGLFGGGEWDVSLLRAEDLHRG